jgi:dCMP deaminase
MPHCIVIPCGGESDEPGNNNKCIAVHAEMNAVTQAASSRRVPYTIYCSATPCFTCAKLLISVGVHRVIALELYKGDTAGCDLMEKAGVAVRIYRDNVLYHWKNV